MYFFEAKNQSRNRSEAHTNACSSAQHSRNSAHIDTHCRPIPLRAGPAPTQTASLLSRKPARRIKRPTFPNSRASNPSILSSPRFQRRSIFNGPGVGYERVVQAEQRGVCRPSINRCLPGAVEMSGVPLVMGWRWKKKTPDSGLLRVVEGHLSVGGSRGPANTTVETEYRV